MKAVRLHDALDLRVEEVETPPPPPPDDGCPVDLRVTFATSATLEIIAWWLGQDEAEALPTERIAAILNRLAITPTVGQG